MVNNSINITYDTIINVRVNWRMVTPKAQSLFDTRHWSKKNKTKKYNNESYKDEHNTDPTKITTAERRCSGRVLCSYFLIDTRLATHIVKSGKSLVSDRWRIKICIERNWSIVIWEMGRNDYPVRNDDCRWLQRNPVWVDLALDQHDLMIYYILWYNLSLTLGRSMVFSRYSRSKTKVHIIAKNMLNVVVSTHYIYHTICHLFSADRCFSTDTLPIKLNSSK
jgi:hypothetical protein